MNVVCMSGLLIILILICVDCVVFICKNCWFWWNFDYSFKSVELMLNFSVELLCLFS